MKLIMAKKRKRNGPSNNFHGKPRSRLGDDLDHSALDGIREQWLKALNDVTARQMIFGGYKDQAETAWQKFNDIVLHREKNLNEVTFPGHLFKYRSAIAHALRNSQPAADVQNLAPRAHRGKGGGGTPKKPEASGPYRIRAVYRPEGRQPAGVTPLIDSSKAAAAVGPPVDELVVFPNPARLGELGPPLTEPTFRHIRFGSGGEDHIDYFQVDSDERDGSNHKFAPVSTYPSGPRLRLRFRHVPSEEPDGNYWYAVVALAIDWEPKDLTRYKTLHVTARAADPRKGFGKRMDGPVHLMLLLEDHDTESNNSSGCQHTSWVRRRIHEWFRDYAIPLNEFDWTRGARAGNTADVDRRNIVQITFGHEGKLAPATDAIVEIKRITFSL